MTIAHKQGENGLARTKYKCDACGKIDFWNHDWRWFGSLADLETCPEDIPHACSKECSLKIESKISKKEFVLPKLQRYSNQIFMDKKTDRKGY